MIGVKPIPWSELDDEEAHEKKFEFPLKGNRTCTVEVELQFVFQKKSGWLLGISKKKQKKKGTRRKRGRILLFCNIFSLTLSLDRELFFPSDDGV